MMQGLKNRTRKVLGLRKKDKDADPASSPAREGSGSGKRGSKKANGAPNGFYGEIDWDRYASPDVDEEGFSLQPADEAHTASRGKEFFSSSDSEDDEDSRKKFKIRIKPLVSDSAKCVPPSMDELKASVGGLALSPSLRRSPRRSPGQMKRNLSCEEIARPRRSTPTASPLPDAPGFVAAPDVSAGTRQQERFNRESLFLSDASQNVPSFFRLPSETRYARYDVVRTDVWGDARLRSESQLSRSFPTGAPPPLPPKNIPSRSHYSYTSESAADLPNGRAARSSAPIYLNVLSPASYRGSPAPDLDDVFGPMDSPHTREDTASPRWVTFAEDRPPPPDEPAPPPPPDSPAPDTPSSTPSSPCLSPGPPPTEPPPSPPSFSPSSPPSPFSPADSPTPIVLEHPPPDEPAPPLPPDFSPSISPPLCLEDDTIDEEVLQFVQYSSSPAPVSPVPPLPAERRSPRVGVTSPLVLGGKRTPEGTFLRDDIPDFVGSPRELTPSFRGTPPPLPPTTYRSIMSSPGPPSGSNPSSPARATTPQSRGSPVPPPPPPRPSSRPKLPPGKPLTDLSRSFSPPISGSPPPFAPLARAESTSSISSITIQSAASTPTLGKDLHTSTTGCSRGPSPITMGPQDTLPVAAAFTETINAYFKGADPSKCVVKITGEMVLSFPAGITRHFSSHPTQPVLAFSISNYSRLEQVLPNPQLLCCEPTTESLDTKEFWVNMPNLMSHLKKVAEQKPQATYYNVDMIKYQVSAAGIQSTPLNLAVSWRGDAASTDLRVDYKYNTEAMAAPVPLHDILFLVPIDGGEAKVQAMVPPATWNPEQQTIQWRISSLSHRSENGGVGALLGRFQMTEGPCRPSQLSVQFTSEGSTLSGCDIQLVGTGYRLSLIKKRFAAGKYLADN
ncbi:SH3-containing GRB2-like protein 3-interacting protein 1 isoform X6 [Takifugu flavidus]|uniref:SH3-containing GRB2-like protein 3-interacting protein 1 isoform X6 n=1 Tax=Takifugu flavidus TaxID=433684 RepID=UPI002544921A|nr:SH3-containing GRB2-like protein 3-interacting protein 1 isoform X6 [Takifugu flavidus]